MSAFSSFFAFGNRTTFSLTYCGREVVGFESYNTPSEGTLDAELHALIHWISLWFEANRSSISTEAYSTYRTFASSVAMSEYQSEIYGFLATFTLMISRV